ncbi:Uncharacterised protein [Mycobacteroides abscessus subsp. abscessus]|nr:Uncharacterised protein [Mycobacteroides abscessus subsp. abscessus]
MSSTGCFPLAVGTTLAHGFLIMPPMKATAVPAPMAPTPKPRARTIILRRGRVEVSRVSCSWATMVLRSTSAEPGPS